MPSSIKFDKGKLLEIWAMSLFQLPKFSTQASLGTARL